MTKFKDLQIGQTFDWINDEKPGQNSFTRPCVKTSARKYRTIAGGQIEHYTVGNINATVYHVDKYE